MFHHLPHLKNQNKALFHQYFIHIKNLKTNKSMKKIWLLLKFFEPKRRKIWCVMKLCLLFILFFSFSVSARISAQREKVSLDISGASLKTLFEEIQKQTGLCFVYNEEQCKDFGTIDLKMKSEAVSKVLKNVFQGRKFSYYFEDKIIVIKADYSRLPQVESFKLKGKVTDKSGSPLPGVAIMLKGTNIGVATDVEGKYILVGPISSNLILTFSFIGMKTKEVLYNGQEEINIVLEDEAANLDEVVVTGIFERKASSFTGSAVSVTKEQLMRVGNQNIFASLRNIDPSLMIFDNLDFGSDPNKMPEMQLRGTSAFPGGDANLDLKGNYVNSPNMPLFVLDGFEASVEKIFDMDMNRVESVTILKDAAAKAIYGSKAANGVVVVETKRLETGELRISYNGNMNITVPDLSSYDLCNAEEKLEIERLNGLYESDNLVSWLTLQRRYNQRLTAVRSGVNTDWLAKPLRTGIGHKHSLSIEMGNRDFRVIADISYNDVVGVMKGSDRVNVSGALSVSYRYKNINFRNELSVTANDSKDSPYGSFSEYAKMNPYWTPYDEHGNLLKNAELSVYANEVNPNFRANPLFNSQLNTRLTSDYLDVTNNFYAEWTVIKGLKTTLRFGITKKENGGETYYPANHLRFYNYTGDDFFRKGTFQSNDGSNKRLSGDLNINFSKQLGEKHYVFGNFGWNLSDNQFQEVIYEAEGFPSDKMDNIMFARQYAKEKKPRGREETVRDMGVLGVINYAYDDRFLVDASYRASASSQFGANNRWGGFWSAGIGWNIHNEHYLKQYDFIQQLKFRASMGYTGAQNFPAYQSMATYSYILDKTYDNFLGAILQGMANNDLKWQKKLDYNIGLDFNVHQKLSLKLDYYISKTENTLIDYSLPTSTGFPSVKENMGAIRNIGFEGKINWTVWSQPANRSYAMLTFAAATNKNKITKISKTLQEYNKQQAEIADDRFSNTKVIQYYEGMSMNAIWAVRSLGIDPANGREIYLDKQGKPTYTYSSQNLVVCGDELPKVQGNFGFTTEYKGMGLNVVFRYMYGAKMYNQTLVDRVENADLHYNVDRRVFTGRWRNAGDQTPFKSLSKVWISEEQVWKEEKTQPTSRFVQKRNELDLSAMSIYYDFYQHGFLKKANIERLKFSFYMNDVYKWSSIKVERGLSYPFARSFNFSLQATF